MAFKLKVKTGTSAPASGALDTGELGYNTTSDVIFIGNGTGNAATEIITDSSTAQIKTGNFTTLGNLGGEKLILEQLTGSSPTIGQLTYDTDSGTFRAGLYGDYVLDLGIGHVMFVENVSGSNIAKGQVVGFSSASGDHIRVSLYTANSSAEPEYLIGIAATAINNNGFGFVMINGKVRGVDTSAYAPGTILYASATTAGTLTSTAPASPNLRFKIAAVVKQNASSGILEVRVHHNVRMTDVHDVAISSPNNGHILIYDNAQARWENNTLTAGSPISITNGAGTITVGLASGYGDTQNPYASKTANTFLAAPNGSNGVPSFRAIVAADIPTLNQNTTGTSAGVVATVAGTNSTELVRGNMADNDQFRILVGGTGSNAGFVEIATADDGTEPIHVRQYTGVFTSLTRTATLLDGSGNTSFPGTVTGTRLISTIATGTAPLSVTSTTAVTNLNADLLDGNHASAFALDNAVVKLTGDQTIAGNKTFSNNVIITGELTVNGATTNINTTNLVVEDKNIILGDVTTPSDITADGGGITLKGASDKTITWVDSTDSWTFNQTIRHEGLNPSTGTNVDQLKSTTFASALTTAWTDVTGVSGTYLATGSYIVQIESNGEYYTGDMSWFSGSTTSTVADEIELHRAGPAASAARIYARVVRVSGSTLKLQVSASTTLSSHTMTFKFRRTI